MDARRSKDFLAGLLGHLSPAPSSCGGVSPIDVVTREQSLRDQRHFVCQGHYDQHAWLSGKHLSEPGSRQAEVAWMSGEPIGSFSLTLLRRTNLYSRRIGW